MVTVVREEPYWRYMCDGCRSKLIAETEDVFMSNDGFYFVQCPVCQYHTEVPPMLLHTNVKLGARRSYANF